MSFLKKKSSRSRKSAADITSTKLTKPKEESEKEVTASLDSSQSESGDFSNTIQVDEEEEEEIDGLVFTGERVNGRPVIKGGNIENLVERLTYEKYNDVKYAKAFMLTFRSFTSPTELLDLLIRRFNIEPPANATKEEIQGFEGVRKVVRLRVFNILKGWLNNGYYDFKDPKLKETLLNFITNQVSKALPNPAQTLLNTIEKKENAEKKEYEHIFTTPPPKPILPAKSPAADECIILAYSPVELARQLTLIEYNLYCAIKPSECVGQNWMSKRKEELAPNILAMIHRFNFVSTWFSSEIVKTPDLAKRTQILKQILDIAEACKQLNNFNALMEIISGLNSSSIFRLKQTWGGLPRKYVAMFEEFRAIMSRDKSYKNFREYLHKVNPPCIPYLGMYLTDLTFVEEGNKDNLPNGYINITKRQQLAQIISEIQTYQNTPYCLQEVPSLRDALFNVEALPEQQCYALSLKRESRDGTVDDQTPDLPFGEIEKKPDYLFDKPDADDNIIYENSDSPTAIVKAASEVKLIERLTYHEYSDLAFTSAYLMCYQSFTSAQKIIELLDNRFQMPRPANPSKQQMAKFQSSRMIPIHLRIVNFLRTWVNAYPKDFIEDTELQQTLRDTIQAWSESNPLLKQAADGLRKVLDKKIMSPLPTPECRYIGFLREDEDSASASEESPKTLFDFDDDLIAQQFTLIEQNFFLSIGARECLCSAWDLKTMEVEAPNVYGMRVNSDYVSRWACTEVLRQPDHESRYRCLAVIITVIDKLTQLKNFSTAVSLVNGVTKLKELLPFVWDWIPTVTQAKWDGISRQVESEWSKSCLETDQTTSDEPVIPYIEPYVKQLALATQLMPLKADNLINFERIRKLYTVFQSLEICRATPYSFDYNEACGGYLYKAEIWENEKIEQVAAEIPSVDPPIVRPEEDDIRNPEEPFQEISDDESEDNATRREEESVALENLRGHLISVMKEDENLFSEFLTEAKANVANDMLEELRSFSACIQDELSIIQSQFGVEQTTADNRQNQQAHTRSQQVLQRIFPGSSITLWTELDSEGVVYGWEDQVNVLKVTKSDQQYLVCVTPQLKKADASMALRLFKFFNESSDSEWTSAIVSSSCCVEATSVLQGNNVLLFDFSGERLIS